MELGGGGGESDAKRARLSSGDADSAAAAGEDRLSALPNGILVLILIRLSTCAAGRTSVLSSRWRRVWALLPALYFRYTPDPRQIGAALEAHEAALLTLCVWTRDAAPDSMSAWLPVPARRLSGALLLNNTVVRERGAQEGDDEEEAAQRGAFELPCLERATQVRLDLGFLGLAVPPAGVFARLTELYLFSVRFHGPGLLGDAVSWPRCPCLQKLNVFDARGLYNLAIHSDSLQQVHLTRLRGLQQLNIVAPALEQLDVTRCFLDSLSQPVASIAAPQLATLQWMDPYDPSSVHLGEMRHLRSLAPIFFMVYGDDSSTHNQSCLSLLQRFKVIERLILTLTYLSDIDDYRYVMEDMTMLPNITILHLDIFANRHAFGASAFHVLRMCSGTRKLMLSFFAPTVVEEAQTTCPPGCICSEHQNWETEHLLLNHLKELEITQMRGSEHEVTFVKQLLIWGTTLEKMSVFFNESVTESVAKELSQVLRSFGRPEIRMEIHT